MSRITKQMVQNEVDTLNRMTNNPLHTYIKVNDRYTASPGNYHIVEAYGGCKLHQIVSTGVGTKEPIYTGYASKRVLFDMIRVFIQGIKIGKEIK